MGVIAPVVVNKYKIDMDDPDVVYIGRGSRWGNQFTHVHTGTKAKYRVATREDAVEAYRQALWSEIRAKTIKRTDLMQLAGKRLACFCHPQACHGDVLAKAVVWAYHNLTD